MTAVQPMSFSETNLFVCFQFFPCETLEWLAGPDFSRYAVVRLCVNEELMNACNINK